MKKRRERREEGEGGGGSFGFFGFGLLACLVLSLPPSFLKS